MNQIEKKIEVKYSIICCSFFQEYPKYQDEFSKFKGRKLDELKNDRQFHAHCLVIMGTFSQAVQFLHDAELCTAGLHMTGERHARRGQDKIPFDVSFYGGNFSINFFFINFALGSYWNRGSIKFSRQDLAKNAPHKYPKLSISQSHSCSKVSKTVSMNTRIKRRRPSD